MCVPVRPWAYFLRIVDVLETGNIQGVDQFPDQGLSGLLRISGGLLDQQLIHLGLGTELVGGSWRCHARTRAAMDLSINLGSSRMGLGCGWRLCSVCDATIKQGGGLLSVVGVLLKFTPGTC